MLSARPTPNGCSGNCSRRPKSTTRFRALYTACANRKKMAKLHATLLLLLLLSTLPLAGQASDSAADWTIYIANDACSDYTWGFDEEQSRRAYADVVRAHLDEMLRTDHEKPENQDRYNLSITQEAHAFL